MTAAAQRLAKRRVDKVAARRAELAAAALKTLAERGYAQTGLRDIAQNSEFSHGVLHYYFADKTDLITECLRHYRVQCADRYAQVMAAALTAEDLCTGLARHLTEMVVREPHIHRLWYDLRNQSMFEPGLRPDVAEIDRLLEHLTWQIANRYAELSGREPMVTSSVLYALLDGLFQQALLRQLVGSAADNLPAAMTRLFSDLFRRA